MRRSRRVRRWAGLDAMELIPVRRVESVADGAAGSVRLLAPRFASGLLGRLLQPRLPRERAHVKVDLDPRGSDIWRAIDGRIRVAELVQLFVDRHPDDADQAPERVWRFLAALEHHGFIALETGGGET